MDADRESLASAYAEISTGELMRMHGEGTLTDEAYQVLESELVSRGVTVPQRPITPQVTKKEGWPSTLRAHWEGRAKLASAFWLLFVLASTAVNWLVSIFVALLHNSDLPKILVLPAHAIVTLGSLAWFFFVAVSVWRCAWNSSWQTWGFLARSFVVFYVLFPVLVAIFRLLAHLGVGVELE